MKGIVFTGFLQMVEETFGYELVDELLEENELESGGIYTSVGTYDFSEMVTLLGSLSEKSQKPIGDLMKAFGLYFFDTLASSYPHFMDAANSAFDFLESIEKYIHVEVKKLYPDAELPTFHTRLIQPNTLEMIYTSERSMGDFAEGLIEKSLLYYKEEASISRENIKENGSEVRFLISKKA